MTDDREAVTIEAQLNKSGTAARHAWFIDFYTCAGHATLAPPPNPTGNAPPSYDLVKEGVITILLKPPSAAPPPERDYCRSSGWIFPGLGTKRSVPNP